MKHSLRKRLEYFAQWLGIWALFFLAVWQFAPVDWLTWAIGFGAAIVVLLAVNAFSGDEARLRLVLKRRAEIDDPSHRISIQNAPRKVDGRFDI